MAKNNNMKHAVLVGCNYPKTENELHGCVNDVMRMQNILIHRFGFAKENINLLIDTDESYAKPTGENIIRALVKMIKQAKPGDVLFFHYSGHGTLVPLQNSTGSDECIVPCDFNLLTDEDFRLMVNMCPPGTSFTMVSDSCHSGGLIDKEKEQIGPHVRANRSLKRPGTLSRRKFLPLESLLRVLREKTGEADMEAHKIKSALLHLFGKKASTKVQTPGTDNCSLLEEMAVNTKVLGLERHELQRSIDPDMGILLSGCQSDETSEDACPTEDLSKAYGAFSNALQSILEQHGKPISNRELVLGARKLLAKEEYLQHPCLYCSDKNADAAFLCEESSAKE
eukprot:PITA_12973